MVNKYFFESIRKVESKELVTPLMLAFHILFMEGMVCSLVVITVHISHVVVALELRLLVILLVPSISFAVSMAWESVVENLTMHWLVWSVIL